MSRTRSLALIHREVPKSQRHGDIVEIQAVPVRSTLANTARIPNSQGMKLRRQPCQVGFSLFLSGSLSGPVSGCIGQGKRHLPQLLSSMLLLVAEHHLTLLFATCGATHSMPDAAGSSGAFRS